MRHALISRTILAPLALIAAATFSSAAPANVGGSVEGRFQVVSPRSTTLEGLVENQQGKAIFRMSAMLIGHSQSGVLLGRWTELPIDAKQPDLLHLEYELVGQYVRDANGAVRIEAQIYLDLRSQGIDVYIHAGEMQGLLRALPQADPVKWSPGFCPGPLPADPMVDDVLPIGGNAALQVSVPASASKQGIFRARYVMS